MDRIPDEVLLEQYRLAQDAELEEAFAFELELFPSDIRDGPLILPRGSHRSSQQPMVHIVPA